MKISRRYAIKALAALVAAPCLRVWAAEEGERVIRINIPGPRSLPFLPIELIPATGIDHALGARLVIRYFPSGVRSLEDVLAGNAHFAALGFSTLPSFLAKGQQVVALAPLSGKVAPYALVVSAGLAGKIHKVSDLKGRSIGVSTGSVTTKSYLQMAAQVVVSNHGLKPTEVRWVPIGQNLEGALGALAGQAVDAVFCEEPFVSALVNKGVGRILLDMSAAEHSGDVPGYRHPRAVLASSTEFVHDNPQSAELMVKMVQRALAWMHKISPEKSIARLGAMDENERRALIAVLKRIPDMYSEDGRFSRKQVEAAIEFMRAANVALPANFDVHTLVAYQWSGNKP